MHSLRSPSNSCFCRWWYWIFCLKTKRVMAGWMHPCQKQVAMLPPQIADKLLSLPLVNNDGPRAVRRPWPHQEHGIETLYSSQQASPFVICCYAALQTWTLTYLCFAGWLLILPADNAVTECVPTHLDYTIDVPQLFMQ